MVATSAVLVAIGGCAALVVGMAAASTPRDSGAESLAPLPSASTSTPAAAGRTYPIRPVPSPADPTFDTRPPTPSGPVAARRPADTASPSAAASRTPAARKPIRTPPHRSVAPPPVGAAPRAPAPVRGQALPLAAPTASATRVITVVAASTRSTTATLQAWTKAPGGGWLRHGGALLAHVGAQGLTSAPNESLSATPIGSFGLTLAFGSRPDPGTPLPYFRTDSADWWVSDSGSPLYNQHARCSAGRCPFNTGVSENLYQAGYVYSYAVVIDYNRFPARPGAGSAFFLHVTDGGPTAGCVSIPAANLVSLMAWLSPAAHPRILIGVA
jgi:L,D-peptidoglycan transpeptidase YkuD (ErfK/YbiS/YcfS/YnhG family)